MAWPNRQVSWQCMRDMPMNRRLRTGYNLQRLSYRLGALGRHIRRLSIVRDYDEWSWRDY